ncbi:MAG TPA: efflux RND transporter periplasmic adaptor subunit [Deltaproteobacteria bacterium]|nr:efflux RND transporter periplasmic adaptor subunit [Deltaproteobacteria bacterium]
MDHVLNLTGDIRPITEIDVYPKVPGKIIEKILVENGDIVKKGALIAVLEDETIKAQIDEADAALALAKANEEVIEKDYARLVNLYEQKAVARQKLDHIDAQRKSSKAQIKRAQAVLEQLSILNKNHRVCAPVSGYISKRYVDNGALSSPAQPIVRITSEKQVKVVTQVTEKDFHLISKGMKCETRVDAFPEKTFAGDICVVSPTIDPASRTGEIEIHLENNERLLRSGMFARLRLYLDTFAGIAVARDALQKTPGTGSYYVFVVKGGKVTLRNIEIGISFENTIEITKGLENGEEVVVRGQNRLKDGLDVVVENQVSRSEDK